jgi:hypothetical protein
MLEDLDWPFKDERRVEVGTLSASLVGGWSDLRLPAPVCSNTISSINL